MKTRRPDAFSERGSAFFSRGQSAQSALQSRVDEAKGKLQAEARARLSGSVACCRPHIARSLVASPCK